MEQVRTTGRLAVVNGLRGLAIIGVLFLPYADGRRKLCAWGDAAGFYRHRFFRLMPLYYFVTLALLARIAGRLWNPGPLGPNFISDNRRDGSMSSCWAW